jgi:hypothetical protein
MQSTLEAVPSECRLLSKCLPDAGRGWSAVLSVLKGRESCRCVNQSDKSHSGVPSRCCTTFRVGVSAHLEHIRFISIASWEPQHSRGAFPPPELKRQRGFAPTRFEIRARSKALTFIVLIPSVQWCTALRSEVNFLSQRRMQPALLTKTMTRVTFQFTTAVPNLEPIQWHALLRTNHGPLLSLFDP